jgi:putative colanic acid biosynthesis glycosyltransferase
MHSETMDDAPYFSIITVCLNNLGGLRCTHESIAAQSFKNVEWIVIDGGSHDGTRDFLGRTQADWVSEKDNGIYDAMNKGLARANGTYLIFMNAGDGFAAPDILQYIYTVSERTRSDFIYGDALEHEYYKRAKSHQKIHCGMFTHHQAMFYKRECLHTLQYDVRYKIAADYKFTVQFLRNLQHEPLYIEKPLCVFEPGGVSQKNAARGRFEEFKIRQELNIGNIASNIALYIGQWAVWNMRQCMPRFYWILKKTLTK